MTYRPGTSPQTGGSPLVSRAGQKSPWWRSIQKNINVLFTFLIFRHGLLNVVRLLAFIARTLVRFLVGVYILNGWGLGWLNTHLTIGVNVSRIECLTPYVDLWWQTVHNLPGPHPLTPGAGCCTYPPVHLPPFGKVAKNWWIIGYSHIQV